MARTLRLIGAIQDLALTTQSLRADWEKRQISILTLVRDLVIERPGGWLPLFAKYGT
jgi:E3 ubiquitin-protein ligase listerin